jgi:putative transcription factor
MPLSPDRARVIVDGVELTVCKNCSSRGKAIPKLPTPKQFRPRPNPRSSNASFGITDNIFLVEEYSQLIRDARLQKKLTHEQVGTMIKEKATLLRRLEIGTLKPYRILAAKLERFLGIRLYIPEDE